MNNLRKNVCAALLIISSTFSAFAYTPMLDEVEGIKSNLGHYLILPAWENSLPGVKQNAYFIAPKYLIIAGTPGANGPEFQFGVTHRGYTTFPNGTGDYPPSVRVLATIELYKNDAEITAIRKELIDRDRKAGLQDPVFPSFVFSSWQATPLVGAVGSAKDALTVGSNLGGAAGQPIVLDFYVPAPVDTAFVYDLPKTAGRDAALWGVSVRGVIPGYANRLKCTVTINHRKVYEHFKARASGQAYWGLVKADLGAETQKMDQDQSIDFGACRGSAEQIDKIVMPIWNKVLELGDQDGNKMFTLMIQKSAGIPGHPEASSTGWGFQLSAGWEKVSYSDSTTINFDISYRGSLEIPFGVAFSTVCSSWKQYFVNGTDPGKPCVSPNDYQQIAPLQKQCYGDNVGFIERTYGAYPDVAKRALERLRFMGCAYDGGFEKPNLVMFVAEQTDSGSRSAHAAVERACRKELLGLISGWGSAGLIDGDSFMAQADSISRQGCAWNAAPPFRYQPQFDVSQAIDGAKVRALKPEK